MAAHKSTYRSLMKPLNMILAATENNAIGRKGGIPWHISEDFKYFKQTTLGHTVIMGWGTWVSLGCKALPGRDNYILAPAERLAESSDSEHVRFFATLDEALAAADDEPFIIGGGYTYCSALPLATRIYLTRIHTVIEDADTFFPELSPKEWTLASSSDLKTDSESGLTFQFLIYERI